jgi:hypothetical protein
MMKKITIILFTILSFHFATAQNRKEKVEAFKIAFITNALNLTPDEAQKFWPIFNEYETKKGDSRKKLLVPARLALANTGTLTEKEVEMHLNNIFLHKTNEIEFQKEVLKKLKPVISINKIAALVTAESNYKLELLKKLKKNNSEE